MIEGQHPLFDSFWATYPKKSNRYAACKMFSVMMAKEARLDFDRFIRCVEIYGLIQNPTYWKDPDNWLREDKWKDFYYEDDVEALLMEHQQRDAAAVAFIKLWNIEAAKHHWWHVVQAINNRKLQVIDALRIQFFKEHYLEAFEITKLIFCKPIFGSDWRSEIKPSIEWFCKDDTVPRLVEGHYGRTKKPKLKYINRKRVLDQVQIEVDLNEHEPTPIAECFEQFWKKMLPQDPKKPNPFERL